MRTPLVFLALPVAATLLGGVFALRVGRVRPLLVAVGAGLLLGAAFLDLLPEAVALGGMARMGAREVLGWTLVFFLGFSGLESLVGGEGDRRRLGLVGGGLLVFHSFRDGMAIGAAFAASHAAGYAVTTGIVAHDFADGMNTVMLTTAGKKARWVDYAFLGADALAPFAGGLLTVWWIVSSRGAAMLLALAAGFFLQMATSDFLPQLRRERAGKEWLMAGVIGGVGVIWGANWLVGGR